jgi:hypothetical protein
MTWHEQSARRSVNAVAMTGLIGAILLILAIHTLRMLPWINVDLAVRFQLWLLDMLRRLESSRNDSERDDD